MLAPCGDGRRPRSLPVFPHLDARSGTRGCVRGGSLTPTEALVTYGLPADAVLAVSDPAEQNDELSALEFTKTMATAPHADLEGLARDTKRIPTPSCTRKGVDRSVMYTGQRVRWVMCSVQKRCKTR